MFAGSGSAMIAANSGRSRRSPAMSASGSFHGHDDRQPRPRRRAPPGSPAIPSVARPGPGLGEQARRRGRGRRRANLTTASRPVVGAGERGSPSSPPRSPTRSSAPSPQPAPAPPPHRRAAPRPSVGAPEACAVRGSANDGLHHRRVRVPGHERAPRADVVDVRVAVGVDDRRPRTARDEQRVAADRTHGADRGVHAPRPGPHGRARRSAAAARIIQPCRPTVRRR